MKRKYLLILALIVPLFVLAGCRTDDPPPPEPPEPPTELYGSIRIVPSVDAATDETDQAGAPTRAANTDPTSYALHIEGNGIDRTMDYPEGGIIDELEEGDYTLTLSSHPEGRHDPAFDTPVYVGSVTVAVKVDKQTEAKIVCTQTNSGIRFIYDPSLVSAGLEGVTPELTSEGKTLTYDGDHRDATGYVNPGSVTVRLTEDGAPVTIDGRGEWTFTAEARKLHKLTLSVETGGMGITVTVETIDTATNETDEIVGDGDIKGTFRVVGGENETVSLVTSDGTTMPVRLDAQGRGSYMTAVATSVRSVKFLGKPEIMIGVMNGTEFEIKVDANKQLVFRDAVGTHVPIGTYGELALVGRDETTMSGNYVQERDIDLMSLEWKPLGKWRITNALRFSGEYDGAGYKIHNLLVSKKDEDYVGLFGYNRGVLKNIHVASGYVEGTRGVGGVCGYSEATITGCSNNASVLGHGNGVGGICGAQVRYYTVDPEMRRLTDCVNTGTIMGTFNYIGGIAGQNEGLLADCRNEGFVSGSASTHVAGICGWNMTNATIENCLNVKAREISNIGQCTGGIAGCNDGYVKTSRNEVPIFGADNSIGGIVGLNNYYIIECTNVGRVDGEFQASHTGGIVGYNNGVAEGCENTAEVKGAYNATGGICGWNNVRISNCDNSGDVSANSGSHNSGGISGTNDGLVENCVNRGDVSVDQSNGGGIVGANDSFISGQDGIVRRCDNYGAVNVISGGFAGGICGTLYMGYLITSENHGSVISLSFSGGVAGQSLSGSYMSGCANFGDITVRSTIAGGVSGYHGGSMVACYNAGEVDGIKVGGGVIGTVQGGDALLSACYSTGMVKGSDFAGGVCARNTGNGATIEDCYWKEVPGGPQYGIAEGTSNSGALKFGPAGDGTGWPDTSMDNWKVLAGSGEGAPGEYWKEYGTWASHGSAGSFPMLWWQE